MKEFFTTYSIQDIVIFLGLFILAVKELLASLDWIKEKLKKTFLKSFKEDLDDKTHLEKIKQQDEKIELMMKELANLNASMSKLIASDKDNIKSWILEKHKYYFYEKKMIDEYTLDCIERRYEHYREEGGNSYVEGLMKDIRSLPKISTIEK